MSSRIQSKDCPTSKDVQATWVLFFANYFRFQTKPYGTEAATAQIINLTTRVLQTAQADHFETATGDNEVPEKVVSADKEHTAFEKLSSAQVELSKAMSEVESIQAILSKAKQRIDQVWSRSGAHKLDEAAELLQGDSKEPSIASGCWK
ncbi:unnamed protein product [Symbiodinium microadriaticum]|nr:unnamed protein product [Symbiodinium microadriaticum]